MKTYQVVIFYGGGFMKNYQTVTARTKWGAKRKAVKEGRNGYPITKVLVSEM